MRRLVAIALLPAALLLAACGSTGKSNTGAATSTPGGAAQTTSTQASGNPPVGANGCQQVSNPPAKPDGGAKKPKGHLATSKTWRLNVRTSCGLFTVTLDPKQSPNAAASMVALAQAGFFKNTVFHRIIPGFVIQGGDPTGADPSIAGKGGPGYSTVDNPPRNAKYTLGVVAMAKTQSEPPGTAGSQFYVVTGADVGLPPDYAIVGKVTNGLATVARIGKLGDQSGTPAQPVIVYDITARGG
jgi:cyclophilin family peptidyl-prolyl cis-trans isomerase